MLWGPPLNPESVQINSVNWIMNKEWDVSDLLAQTESEEDSADVLVQWWRG